MKTRKNRKLVHFQGTQGMKRIISLVALLLCAGCMFGQTIEQLMAKWKTMPGAQYEVKTRAELLHEMENDTDVAKSGLSKDELHFIKKNLKRNEQITLQSDSVLQEMLNKDIQALKGFEQLMEVNKNFASNEDNNPLQQLWNKVMNPQIKVSAYGRVNGDIVDNLLIRMDVWDKIVLGYFDCKFKKKSLSKLILIERNSDDAEREKDDAVDMKTTIEEVQKDHALFVINGEEHPELHSSEEARVYMEEIDFHHNNETWVVGRAVKEKYPETDRKVVIEYNRERKDTE